MISLTDSDRRLDKMRLPLLYLLCLSLARGSPEACVVCHEEHQPDGGCRGSLSLISGDSPARTKVFLYDSASLSCEPENLERSFIFSRAEVGGCGEFILYNRRNGRGASQVISYSQTVSARELHFRRVRSVQRLGCPPHLNTHNSAATKKSSLALRRSADTKRRLLASRSPQHPGDRSDGVEDPVQLLTAQKQIISGESDSITEIKARDSEDRGRCEVCQWKTILAVSAVPAVIFISLLGLILYSLTRGHAEQTEQGDLEHSKRLTVQR